MAENKEIQETNLELQTITFEDIETVEEIVTGAVSGLVVCCVA